MIRKVIGLTGNIGVGKSTVLAMLRALGADVIDADQVAHAVMRPGEAAYEGIVAAFGADILAPDGAIDRVQLGARVFRDAEALQRLEAIVHPAVFVRTKQRLTASQAPVVVIEAIKLLEATRTTRNCACCWHSARWRTAMPSRRAPHCNRPLTPASLRSIATRCGCCGN